MHMTTFSASEQAMSNIFTPIVSMDHLYANFIVRTIKFVSIIRRLCGFFFIGDRFLSIMLEKGFK